MAASIDRNETPTTSHNSAPHIAGSSDFSGNDGGYNPPKLNLYPLDHQGEFSVLVDSSKGSSENEKILNSLFLYRKIRNFKVSGIRLITPIGRTLYRIKFDSASSANAFVCKDFSQVGLKPFIPDTFIYSYGVIHGIPLDLTEDYIRESATSEIDIVSVKRFSRRDKEAGTETPTLSVKIGFRSGNIPEHIILDFSYIKAKSTPVKDRDFEANKILTGSRKFNRMVYHKPPPPRPAPHFVPIQPDSTDPLRPVRPDGYGGCAVCIRRSIVAKRINFSTSLDIIIVKTLNLSPNFVFVSVYLPPSLSTRTCASELLRLLAFLDGIPNVILSGDFNARYSRLIFLVGLGATNLLKRLTSIRGGLGPQTALKFYRSLLGLLRLMRQCTLTGESRLFKILILGDVLAFVHQLLCRLSMFWLVNYRPFEIGLSVEASVSTSKLKTLALVRSLRLALVVLCCAGELIAIEKLLTLTAKQVVALGALVDHALPINYALYRYLGMVRVS
ncbi:hypothetical protein EVAR_70867_1 [Eumeta japonica]|uniref:Endonuclease/exonuclease/phosphatase domain-containing protein n=1 Tax=Eumeta variegata TaxID=151549 RepID=A0A4C1SES1_EUMVA|nr:hypothetical protein EVAR_70867_1 [Eumeta japonica]